MITFLILIVEKYLLLYIVFFKYINLPILLKIFNTMRINNYLKYLD